LAINANIIVAFATIIVDLTVGFDLFYKAKFLKHHLLFSDEIKGRKM